MTQGTIFSCAVAADYVDCSVYGLILTARCDIAHDKVRIHNYLPIVNLDDWLRREGRLILAQRLQSEATGGMRSVLREAGYSTAVLETEGPRAVFDTLFPQGSERRLREKFEKFCLRSELALRCASASPSEKSHVNLGEEVPKMRDSLISELVRNDLGGFYFLASVEPNGSDLGYVGLLREIQTLPRDLAYAVSTGLEKEQYESMCQSQPAFRDRLVIARDDLAYPIGHIDSPHLEHLLQTFAFLFGRIGLEDPTKNYIEGLWKRQPTISESLSQV